MKAHLNLSSAIEKSINILAFIPVMLWVFYPHLMARADFSSQSAGSTAQVFEVKGQIPNPKNLNTDQTLSADTAETANSLLSYDELAANDLDHQTKLAYKEQLAEYLTSRRSPFAACVDTLVELKNADKIMSLANAESGLGLRAPYGKYNYWGIGGSNLWKMGNNTCEGIVSMDNFLNAYPRKSAVKYTDMSLVQMCGLYKQPCPGGITHHWVKNNQALLNKLAQLKVQSTQIAFERISNTGNTVHTAIAVGAVELVQK